MSFGIGYFSPLKGDAAYSDEEQDDGIERHLEVSDYPIAPAPVVYFGIPFRASEDALERLPSLVEEHQVVTVDDMGGLARPSRD